MWKVAAAALLSLLAQDPKVTELAFTADGADQKTLERCAQQLRRRIADYGYKGVTVFPTDHGVTAAFDPGFSPAMAQAIERLAKIKGEAFLWAVLPMSDKEFEQWIPGKTSPPGTTWLIDENQKLIMDDSWKVPLEAKFERYAADGGVEMKRLSFSKTDSKKFLDRYVREKIARRFQVMLDGKRFQTPGNLAERTQWMKGERIGLGIMDWMPSGQPTDEVLAQMIAMASPMPVELRRSK